MAYVDSAQPPTGLRQVVCRTSDVPAGQMRSFVVGGRDVVVIHGPRDTYYAMSNECTHAEASLDMGELLLDRSQIECPLHGGRFDFTTGQPTEEPCEIPVRTYHVELDGSDVVVTM